MKKFHSLCFWFFVHTVWLITSNCLEFEPLDEFKFENKYSINESIENPQPSLSTVKFGNTKDELRTEVAIKFESEFYGSEGAEIKFFERLQKNHSNLAKFHLVYMLDHGNWDGDHVIILKRLGESVAARWDRLYKGIGYDWPTVCKIMTQVFIAVEYLHNADILHFDINLANVAFGTEKVPPNGVRSEDVMYENDVFLFDLNNSIDLRNSTLSRRDDIQALGSRLLDLSNIFPFSFSWSYKDKRYFPKLDEIYEHIDSELSGESEKKTALKKFFKLEVELYKCKTEEEVKKAINYDAFRAIFAMNGQDGKKDSKTGKKAENNKASAGAASKTGKKVDNNSAPAGGIGKGKGEKKKADGEKSKKKGK